MRSECGPGARLAPARPLVGRLPGPLLLPWSRPFLGSVTALRLRARKERVGVIRRSTMLLSQALSCRLRSGGENQGRAGQGRRRHRWGLGTEPKKSPRILKRTVTLPPQVTQGHTFLSEKWSSFCRHRQQHTEQGTGNISQR